MIRIVALLLLLVSSSALAQAGDSPLFVYDRSVIRLIPKPETHIVSTIPAPKLVPLERDKDKKAADKKTPDKPAKEKGDEKEKQEKAGEDGKAAENEQETHERTPIEFSVESKSPDFLAQDDFISHDSFPTHEGLLIVLDPAGDYSLTATRMVSTSDILFINEDGYITKIAPNLNLAELSEAIPSKGAVKALLFVKAGTVSEDKIALGDHFEGDLFKTHPYVLQ